MSKARLNENFELKVRMDILKRTYIGNMHIISGYLKMIIKKWLQMFLITEKKM